VLKHRCTPFTVVEHNKDAFRVIVEHFIVMTICIADDEVKYASINNIKQQRSSLIQGRTSNISAIMFSIIFPPTNKSILLQQGHMGLRCAVSKSLDALNNYVPSSESVGHNTVMWLSANDATSNP